MITTSLIVGYVIVSFTLWRISIALMKRKARKYVEGLSIQKLILMRSTSGNIQERSIQFIGYSRMRIAAFPYQ